MISQKALFSLGTAVVCALVIQACDNTSDPSLHLTGTEEAPLMAMGVDGGTQPTCPSPKVLVCHVPPGNPANAHTICVGQPAVKAHQKNHGDNVGACGGGSTPTTPVTPVPPPPPPPVQVVDAGPACVGLDGACTSTGQCCGTMVCAAGENVCLPLIQ